MPCYCLRRYILFRNSRSRPPSAAVAETAGEVHTRAGEAEPRRAFLRDRHTGRGAAKARKVARVATGPSTAGPRLSPGGAEGPEETAAGEGLRGESALKERSAARLQPTTPPFCLNSRRWIMLYRILLGSFPVLAIYGPFGVVQGFAWGTHGWAYIGALSTSAALFVLYIEQRRLASHLDDPEPQETDQAAENESSS